MSLAEERSILAAGVALVAVLIGGCRANSGHSPVTAAVDIPSSPTALQATATHASEGSPTPDSLAALPRLHAIGNGEALPSENGLLFVNLDSGEMQFWALPGPYAARPISRDGRWVVWRSSAVNSNHLLDTRTGKDRVLEIRGSPAVGSDLSPSGNNLVLYSSEAVALVDTESGTVIASERKSADANPNGASAFSTDGSAAQGLAAGKGPRTVILRRDGSSSSIEGGTWPLRWSPEGRRLAVTTPTGIRIVSDSGDSIREISLGNIEHGYNLRWSPDGRYLAIANSYSVGGQRIFDASSGTEVLRTVGTQTCLGNYWLDDGTLEYGWEGQRVSVPSGQVLSGIPRWPRDEGFSFDQSSAANGLNRLLLNNGKAVEFQSGVWSVYYDGEGVRSTTSNGKALFLVGIGGKGLCDGTMPPLEVRLPPFQE